MLLYVIYLFIYFFYNVSLRGYHYFLDSMIYIAVDNQAVLTAEIAHWESVPGSDPVSSHEFLKGLCNFRQNLKQTDQKRKDLF